MTYKVTQKDEENPQRFISEGLGAPEARIAEAKARPSAGRIHCLCADEQWIAIC